MLEDGECVDVCDDNEAWESGRCVTLCPSGQELLGEECVPTCKRDEERDTADRSRCYPRCPEGEERYEGECVTSCTAAEQRVEGVCVGPPDVRVNSVGYLPKQAKVAVLAKAADQFEVIDVETESVVLEGDVTGPVDNPDTKEELWFADFSELEEEGRYMLRAEDVGDSAKFRIGDSIYDVALEQSMLGFYGLRCGTTVSYEYAGDTFAHGSCHQEDGYSSLSGGELLESTGGWHDAGDYGKYVTNGAFSVGMLLMAWEHFQGKLEQLELEDIPEHGGPIPDFLAEVKWELDWLFSMQHDDGSVAHKLTAANFSGFIMPGDDQSRRAMSPISAEATADFVAVMAMAARIYDTYDEDFAERCLDAAKLGFEFLQDNPNLPPVDLTGFSTGQYKSGSSDDRVWAAAELWVSSGDESALEEFEQAAASLEVSGNWDWPNVGNLGVFSYVMSEREGSDAELLDTLKQKIIDSADGLEAASQEHGYGRALDDYYNWGVNGSLARTTLNLGVAYQLTDDAKYTAAALKQLDHLFGVNVFGRSQVTGLGHLPPLHPHHRPSGADTVAAPWPGLLVGGPNPYPDAEDLGYDISIAAAAWQDIEPSYWSNEIAINWNAALVYGLAWFALE